MKKFYISGNFVTKKKLDYFLKILKNFRKKSCQFIAATLLLVNGLNSPNILGSCILFANALLSYALCNITYRQCYPNTCIQSRNFNGSGLVEIKISFCLVIILILFQQFYEIVCFNLEVKFILTIRC